MAIAHSKRKTSKSERGVAVYDLGNEFKGQDIIDIDFNEIYDGKGDPKKDIIKLITEAIHGIPSLFNEVDLEHVQVYLGKTAEHRISYRSEEHWHGKDTPYFIPLIKVSNKEIDYIEKLGIKYLNFLSNNNHLCFGKLLNGIEGGGGRKSEAKTQVIYLTFRIDKRNKSNPISREGVNLAIGHMYYSLNNEFSKDANPEDIKEILYSIYKTRTGLKLYWDEDSRE